MHSDLSELTKTMSELADGELLRIVEVDYSGYRQDALDCAKQELASRGIQFNQPASEREPVEEEQTSIHREVEEEQTSIHEKLVTVASFSAAYEAHLAKGLLESNGIAAFVADDHFVSTYWFLSNAVGGVKVQVAETDVEEALRVLDRRSEPGDVDPKLDEGWGNCPICGSGDVRYFTAGKASALLTWFIVSIPLLFPSKKLFCLSCHSVWDYQGETGEASLIKPALFTWVFLIALFGILVGALVLLGGFFKIWRQL